MSGQLIELVIFAAIAFFIISKLIATLGTTNDEKGTPRSGFFGEGPSIKDVTPAPKAPNGNNFPGLLRPSFGKKTIPDLDDIIVKDNKDSIISGIEDVTNSLASFNAKNFIKGSKAAFKMILQAKDSDAELEDLIDKRYIEHFKSVALSYGSYNDDEHANLDAKISEIYMFGHNIFIKVLFDGKNITSKMNNIHEEWTFTKSTLSSDASWHLTNIDRPS